MLLRPALALTALALGHVPSLAAEVELGANLLSNGGAELRTPLDPSKPDGPAGFEGWVRTGNVFFNRYSAFPAEHVDAAGDVFGEGRFLGGNSESSRLEQTVRVGPLAQQIDAGAITYTLRGWLGAARQADGPNDQARLLARFLDARGREVGSASLSSPTVEEFTRAGTPVAVSGPITCLRREATGLLPAKTRSIAVELAFTRSTGTILNASADLLELILTPAGTAAPPHGRAPAVAAAVPDPAAAPGQGGAEGPEVGRLAPVVRFVFDDYGDEVLQVAFSPAGNAVTAAGRGGHLGSWDLAAGQFRGRLPIADTVVDGHTIRGLGYGGVRNGLLAAASSTNKSGAKVSGVLTIWDLESRRVIHIRSLQPRSFSAAAIQQGGPLVVAGQVDRSVHVWDTTRVQPRADAPIQPRKPVPDRLLTLGELVPLVLDAPVTAVAIQPNAAAPALAAGGEDGSLWILRADRDQGRILRQSELLSRKGAVTGLAFGRDGRVLGSSSADGVVTVWDVATGREIRTHEVRGIASTGLAFSPDGRLLASSFADGSVRFWDASTGADRGSIAQTHEEKAANSVAFSPDGRLLATGGADFKVRVWELRDAADPEAPAAVPAPGADAAPPPGAAPAPAPPDVRADGAVSSIRR